MGAHAKPNQRRIGRGTLDARYSLGLIEARSDFVPRRGKPKNPKRTRFLWVALPVCSMLAYVIGSLGGGGFDPAVSRPAPTITQTATTTVTATQVTTATATVTQTATATETVVSTVTVAASART